MTFCDGTGLKCNQEGCGNIKKDKIIAGTIFASFIFLILFILFIPFIFSGPASPFFTVHNHDAKNHTVVIEVFDSCNHSVLAETYELGPDSDISRKRPFGLSLPLAKGEFFFKVTVDGTTTGTNVDIPNPHTRVNIRLYYEDYMGNVTPISVETAPIV